ncbi:MAG: hypothetical protein Q4D14_07990, partial [Bacteroidales bacterium]|nr:hypothetical protein [Bacteroidales bacterium]
DENILTVLHNNIAAPHIKQIASVATKIILFYALGEKPAEDIFQDITTILQISNVNFKVVLCPDKSVAAFVKNNPAEEVVDFVHVNQKSFVDAVIDICSAVDIKDPIDIFVPMLRSITDTQKRSMYVHRIAMKLSCETKYIESKIK